MHVGVFVPGDGADRVVSACDSWNQVEVGLRFGKDLHRLEIGCLDLARSVLLLAECNGPVELLGREVVLGSAVVDDIKLVRLSDLEGECLRSEAEFIHSYRQHG